ncbi:MAG: hypothetical protein IJT98_04450 [Prevotella sp.]|nr:hypothetical protein [Prevotella sp.]
MTKRLVLFLLSAVCLALPAAAQGLDSLRHALEQASVSQVQEKVYVHTDNACYFVGDTLWYKAYVVRADNLMPTDMSRLLYVELLSPDGLLVERQTVVVSPDGNFSCGQFLLEDSLYSGYYELRAYTRWMLNFNMRHHYYRTDETWHFYNRQMAADYYRVWDGLYSRVLPVYSKPDSVGDYDVRRMYQRPKTRLPRQKRDELLVQFYPEGGHLIAGVENHIAFEVTDQNGQAVNVRGKIQNAQQQAVDIQTEYMGRGSFTVTPSSRRLKATFTWNGRDWSFDLPRAESQGAAMHIEGNRLTVIPASLPASEEYGVSILCRGVLKHFQKLQFPSGNEPATLALPLDSMPSGVANITLFNGSGQILADRLIFVNNHEHDDAIITANVPLNQTYDPYQQVEVPVTLPEVSGPATFSLAIRDSYTDEPTYNDGNLMTDLLLSSELRGFIAYPAHYFEADDDMHRRHLDLLMMVQGWRKYKWEELAQGSRDMRYQPERTLTVEGAVYKTLGITPVEPDEVSQWQYGVGRIAGNTEEDDNYIDPWADDSGDAAFTSTDEGEVSTGASDYSLGSIGDANNDLGVNHGNLRREVLVEAELTVGRQTVGSVQRTQNGRFVFEIPPFYGIGYLNMKAYKVQDSLRLNMASRQDTKWTNEDEFPDFYVKRDLFFPIFTHDYTYYEKHQPEISYEMLIDTLSELSMENDVHQLGNVSVRGHRRGRRAVDWHKPAFVMNAYDLYNDITDRGLSYGKLDMRQFPVQVCRLLFGNMNYPITYNVDGRLEGHTYYRNYSPFTSNDLAERSGLFVANRTSQYMYRQLKLKRLQDIRVFTDYEPRTEDSLMTHDSHAPDATVELALIPDDGVQPTFRDRHIYLRGISEPWEFYQPNYNNMTLDDGDLPADYRRTLYWNPNARTDEHGVFTARFFNNGKQTRITVSAAGISPDGRLMHSR